MYLEKPMEVCKSGMFRWITGEGKEDLLNLPPDFFSSPLSQDFES